jgi:hypothetical protein
LTSKSNLEVKYRDHHSHNLIDAIIEIILEALETLPPYRVAIGMRMKTLSENGDKNTRSETERIVPQQEDLLGNFGGRRRRMSRRKAQLLFDLTAVKKLKKISKEK